MNTPWKPLILGHRGARGLAPENTLPAFQVAADLGLPAAELDVHLTADGHLVVIHDHTVDRTTDGTGRVDRMTLAQLRALDAAARWRPAFRGAVIPTLDEVLDRFGARFMWEIELKVDDETDAPALVRAAAACAARHGPTDRLTLTSFSPGALAAARAIAPELARGIIASTAPFVALGHALDLGCATIALHQSLLAPDVVARVRASGIALRGWQGNTPEELERLSAASVDGFSSDRPDVALAWLRERGHHPPLAPPQPPAHTPEKPPI